MKSRLSFLALSALLAGGIFAFLTRHQESANGQAASGDKKEQPKEAVAPYVHTVVFYLKEDAPRDEVESIIADGHRLLAKIPSVRGLWIGRPADKSTPRLATTDYDVSWVLLFDDYAGLEEYLEHKLH